MQRTGGRLVVDTLRANGADRIFCVPGESYLAVLDALYDAQSAIELIVCRQEGGAACMAEAYGKLTGRPGIAFATRGPGAANGSIGVHIAYQDASPMILFLGAVPRRFAGRNAFQEVDFTAMFAPLAKWATSIESADRIPEIVAHAFAVAVNGRPGPVVVALPEDVLTETSDVLDIPSYARAAAHPDRRELALVRALLAQARRPLVLAGGSGWTETACDDLAAFARANDLPVAVAFRRQDRVDHRSPHYVGDAGIGIDPALAQRVRDADLILAFGALLGEATTSGYTLLDAPVPRQRLIHVHPGSEELGRVYRPTLAINAGVEEFLAAVRALDPIASPPWGAWRESARADYLANVETPTVPGDVNPAEIVKALRASLPDDAIVTIGAGNFTGWVQRFFEYRRFATQLGSTNGSMGYAIPAALAAQSIAREKIVVAWSGDGDFLMTGQELATAVAYDLRIVAIVLNNGMYGTIRMHQEIHHPGRVIGTTLHNPDFAGYARSFGAHGEMVRRTDEFEAALERALGSHKPAVIEVAIDPEAISTRTTISAIRASRATSR
jgi:acetolactate synthase I/II/III large subunit